MVTDVKAKKLLLSSENSGSIATKDILVDGDASVLLANSGSISVGRLKAKTVDLSSTGSGTINIDGLFADSLTSSLGNSGTVSIADGVVNHQDLEVSNSGKYSAADVKSKTAKITLSNSGSAYVSVSEEVFLDMSGSGDLYLHGKPKFNSISTTGSGKIHTM